MWSYARLDLGLTDREFWELNPRTLFWLGKSYRDRIARDEQAVGLICAAVANHGMRTPKKWAMPSDYMPTELVKKFRADKAQAPVGIVQAIRGAMTELME